MAYLVQQHSDHRRRQTSRSLAHTTKKRNQHANSDQQYNTFTHISNNRYGNILGFDRWVRGRHITQKSIASGLQFSSFLLITRGFACSDAFPLLPNAGILIIYAITGPGAALGPHGRWGGGVERRGSIRGYRRCRRPLAIMLWVDGIRRTVIVTHIVSGFHTGPSSLASRVQHGTIGGGNGGRSRREIVRGGLGLVVRWRRVINDNNLLGNTIFIKFIPIRILPFTILCRGNPRAYAVLGRSHGRRRGGWRRSDFGGLSKREGGRRRVESVRIRGGSQTSGGSSGRGRI